MVRGATVFAAPSRPGTSLCSLLSPLATAFAPIIICFVVSDLLYVAFSPDANLDSSNRLNRRNRKSFLSYPPAESVPADAHEFCYFNSRVGRHFYNRIGLYELSSKKRTRMNAVPRGSIRAALKSIAFRLEFGASEGTRFVRIIAQQFILSPVTRPDLTTDCSTSDSCLSQSWSEARTLVKHCKWKLRSPGR